MTRRRSVRDLLFRVETTYGTAPRTGDIWPGSSTRVAEEVAERVLGHLGRDLDGMIVHGTAPEGDEVLVTSYPTEDPDVFLGTLPKGATHLVDEDGSWTAIQDIPFAPDWQPRDSSDG